MLLRANCLGHFLKYFSIEEGNLSKNVPPTSCYNYCNFSAKKKMGTFEWMDAPVPRAGPIWNILSNLKTKKLSKITKDMSEEFKSMERHTLTKYITN